MQQHPLSSTQLEQPRTPLSTGRRLELFKELGLRMNWRSWETVLARPLARLDLKRENADPLKFAIARTSVVGSLDRQPAAGLPAGIRKAFRNGRCE